MMAQSNELLNGNTLDYHITYEVEREVKDEWEVVDEEGV